MKLRLFLSLAGAWLCAATHAGEVTVAVAANFTAPMQKIAQAFEQDTGHKAQLAFGATGKFYAQIKNGAPFDLFLSADLDYPQALIKAGHADAKTLTTFAIGRLVLWTTKPDLAATDLAATVKNPSVQKLAVANPATAPYGRAALQVLDHLGLTAAARPKLVTGENITQTAQFVETGHADAGFVALSLVLSPKLKDKGRWTEVPTTLYTPLDQGVVLTVRGAANPAATRYLAFLSSPAARKILQDFGYALPAS